MPLTPAAPRRELLRWGCLGLLAVAFAASVVARGVPFDRQEVLGWSLAGMAAASIGRPTGVTRILRDWLPFAVLLVAYDYSRGAVDTLGFPVRWTYPIRIDEALFGELPTLRLQHWMQPVGPPRWWEALMSLMYASHFIAPFVVAAVLWVRDRDRWLAYVRRFVLLTVMALLTFLLLPTAPPWLASRVGYVPQHVVRSVGRGWRFLHLGVAERVLETGRGTVNLVAAVPSLHSAYAALIVITFWARAPRWARALLVLYPVGMGVTLVASGEHYAIDVFIGFAYAALAAGAVGRWERRRAARAVPVPVPAPVPAP